MLPGDGLDHTAGGTYDERGFEAHIPGVKPRNRSRDKGGTGLGLYITKKVIDDHHGSIDVASTLGVGTTFTLRLPLQDK